MTVGGDHHEPVVDGLAEVWSSFAAACVGIGPEQWDLPTDCPGWTVKDQLAHVIGVERMVMGDEAPPPLEVVPDHVRNEFAALNEPGSRRGGTHPARTSWPNSPRSPAGVSASSGPCRPNGSTWSDGVPSVRCPTASSW